MSDGWQDRVDPKTTAFFLDVDGTLLGFKDRPEDVIADPELLDLLRRLDAKAGGAVALVSGRAVADLDRIVAPLKLPVGGVHGADLRYADGRRETMEAGALDEVRSAAEAFVAANEGLRLEDKGATLAIHFRAVPTMAGEVDRFLEGSIAGHDLMIQHGKMVAEVKSGHSHKGKAIELLLATPPFAGRTPLFIGDDLTDERGFEAVDALGGISVKVGPDNEATVAKERLHDVDAVRAFLSAICRPS